MAPAPPPNIHIDLMQVLEPKLPAFQSSWNEAEKGVSLKVLFLKLMFQICGPMLATSP